MSIRSKIKHVWNNVFTSNSSFKNEPSLYNGFGYPTFISSSRPDRPILFRNGSSSIINMIYNRIAVDISMLDFHHVNIDKDGHYISRKESSVENIISRMANIDQSGRELIRDLVISMFDEGCACIVPVDTEDYYDLTYDILSARIGKITSWDRSSVEVELFNEITQNKERIKIPKSRAVIIENPFYAIMNESSSIAQRLSRALSQSEQINAQNSSGKLDLIIQLPYSTRSPAQRELAKERLNYIEDQLNNSYHGIAYVDGTEKIVQLNRAVENKIYDQVKDLTSQLMTHLGLTENVFNGTASETEMMNYYDRSLRPIATTISEAITNKWIISRSEKIMFFRNPFTLVPPEKLADIADSFKRNEILSSNEVRGIIGYEPIKSDPKADQLVNSNISQPNDSSNQESENSEDGNSLDKQQTNKSNE